jgi:hypothetical protein
MPDSKPAAGIRRRWWKWVAVILAADLAWFCALYPVLPRSVSAAVLEALLPVPLFAYIYVVWRLLFWVSNRGIAAIAGGIWMVDWTVIHTSAEYGYSLMHRL